MEIELETVFLTAFNRRTIFRDNMSKRVARLIVKAFKNEGTKSAIVLKCAYLPAYYPFKKRKFRCTSKIFMKKYRQNGSPKKVVMLGESSDVDKVSVELVASRVCASNCGRKSSEHFMVNPNIRLISDEYCDNESIALSYDCGSMQCNSLYYDALERFWDCPESTVIFIHIPQLKGVKRSERSTAVNEYKKQVVDILNFLICRDE